MLKVADFNVLHSSELTEFFRASPENRIVVTDNMATECLKRDGTANFRQSFNLLHEFCDRVLVLRPFKEARRLPPLELGFREALIDANKTLNFPGLCRRFRAGDPNTLTIIEDQQLKNQDFVTKLRQLVDQHLRAAFDDLNLNVGPDWINRLRRNGPVDIAQRNLVRWFTNLATMDAFKSTFPSQPFPEPPDQAYWFPFRYNVALTSLWLDWQRSGWQNSIPANKLLNDNLDIIYIAYGTCFDGVLSGDQKLQRIAAIADAVLADYASDVPVMALPSP
ncbi:MAG TPA: hypothetical protein VG838_13535 [Opitutaceae bacterium]|nr:hypothetical protein [Lacunisphaera sp.]HWA10463.1 hypothetical protein [Opitutaceae bacterium]